MNFYGSYTKDDVEFLLHPYSTNEVPTIDVTEKEILIQNGRHYSEFFTFEKLPTPEYLSLFHAACNENCTTFAQDLLYLAAIIDKEKQDGKIILVSLARAGTPIGVLLKHILEQYFSRECYHYSVSIIRDRGIDTVALNYIRNKKDIIEENITFIDGWTGKGVIGEELQKSIVNYNKKYNCALDSSLYVVADISGTAQFSATTADYLIPSAILNSTVSGLVSRTILNDTLVGENEFHACVYYEEYEKNDLSKKFIFDIMNVVKEIALENLEDIKKKANTTESRIQQDKKQKEALRNESYNCITSFMAEYNISSRNFVKPGIGEATRVLLRRMAHLLILREEQNPATAHLQRLAFEKNVPIKINNNLPYHALALICDLK